MLDLMRAANRRKTFVWAVVMFVVLSFVIAIFAIWGGAATGGVSLSGNAWVAVVDGVEVSARDFDRHRQRLDSYLRQQLGDQYEQQTSMFDVGQIALGQAVGQALAYAEGQRLGLGATEEEISRAIRTSPNFQRNGQFIGRDQYLEELRRRGYAVEEYENEIGRELTVDKLRDVIGSLVTVSDREADEIYRREGQTAEIDYIHLAQADYPVEGEPKDRDIKAWFDSHRDDYMTPEKRRAAYVMIRRDPLRQSVQVSEEEIQQEYDKNKETRFTTPEQWRASHILFKFPPQATPEQEQEVEARARQVLDEVRAGGDFAELARQHSEDGSSQQGGDLGWFGKGRMVPEFEEAVLALSDGEVSDLVRSPFGYHIIKRTGERPAGARPLEEVRDQIKQQIEFRKTQDLLAAKSTELAAKLDAQESSFEATAAEAGYDVNDTGLFAKDEPVGSLGFLSPAASAIFSLQPGEHTGPITTTEGTFFGKLLEVQEPRPAEFDAVKDQVRQDYIASRSLEKARSIAREIAKAGPDGFKQAVDKKEIQFNSTGELTRATAPAVFNDAVKDAIFSAEAGGLAGPVDTTDGVVLAKVIKLGPTTEEEAAQVKEQLRQRLLAQKQDEAFQALLQRLQKTASIELNQDLLAQISNNTVR